jgi:YcxB-like protein
MQTHFSGKLTEPDFKDVRRMVRSKMYWPKLLAANWYGVLLLCALAWATVAGLVGRNDPNWKALGIFWVVIAGIIGWAFYSTKKSIAKESAQLNATLPDGVTIENGGVKLELPAGATAFHPWQSFRGWREGQRVILLDKTDQSFIMVPVAELPEIDRESLRQFLRGAISSSPVARQT